MLHMTHVSNNRKLLMKRINGGLMKSSFQLSSRMSVKRTPPSGIWLYFSFLWSLENVSPQHIPAGMNTLCVFDPISNFFDKIALFRDVHSYERSLRKKLWNPYPYNDQMFCRVWIHCIWYIHFVKGSPSSSLK